MSKFARLSRLWPHIPACTAAAREGTLSAAAGRLGVDRTTVARAIAAAEEVLGARLFERRTGRLHLTEAGRAFVAQAEAAELQVRDAAGVMLEGGAPSTPVRVAIPTNLADAAAPIVFRLLAEHPDLQLTVIGGYGLDDVGGREVDIALRVLREPPAASHYAENLGEVRGRLYRAANASAGGPVAVARSEAEAAETGARLVVGGIVEHTAFVAASGVGRLADFMARDRPDLIAASERLPAEGWALWLVTQRALRHLEPYAKVFEAFRRLRLTRG